MPTVFSSTQTGPYLDVLGVEVKNALLQPRLFLDKGRAVLGHIPLTHSYITKTSAQINGRDSPQSAP